VLGGILHAVTNQDFTVLHHWTAMCRTVVVTVGRQGCFFSAAVAFATQQSLKDTVKCNHALDATRTVTVIAVAIDGSGPDHRRAVVAALDEPFQQWLDRPSTNRAPPNGSWPWWRQ
jgi:hypothetical protein